MTEPLTDSLFRNTDLSFVFDTITKISIIVAICFCNGYQLMILPSRVLKPMHIEHMSDDALPGDSVINSRDIRN